MTHTGIKIGCSYFSQYSLYVYVATSSTLCSQKSSILLGKTITYRYFTESVSFFHKPGDSIGWSGCEAPICVHAPRFRKKRKLSIYRRRLIQSKCSHRGCVKYLGSDFEMKRLWLTARKLMTIDHLRRGIFVHFVNRGRGRRKL
jgi:hypothetical protein